MATYYVATTGSNANPGTQGQPWLTLDYALSYGSLAAGDTILLAAGTYNDVANTDIPGSNGSPITIQGAGIDQTIITKALTIDQDWYVVSGITFDGFHEASGALTGGRVHLSTVNDIEIHTCRFTRGGTDAYGAITCDDGTPGTYPNRVHVHDCTFDHCIADGMVTMAGDDHIVEDCTFDYNNGYDAVRVFGDGTVIRRNTFKRINSHAYTALSYLSLSSNAVGTGEKTFAISSGAVITAGDRLCAFQTGNSANKMTGFVKSYSGTTLVLQVYSTSGSGTISDWTIHYNSPSFANHADVIQSFSASNIGASNIYFYQNRIEDCTGQFGNLENSNSNVSGFNFWNNLFLRSRHQLNCSVPDCTVYNNTIVFPLNFPTGFRFASGADNAKVKNNVFIRVQGSQTVGDGAWSFSGITGAEADYNLVTNLTDGAFSALSAGAHSINGGYSPDQILSDTDADDYSPAVGSPAVGSGVDLSAFFTTDYNGVTRVLWDMGAILAPVPTAPTSLTATATGSSAIALTWTDNASDETGYVVERSLNGTTGWTQIATLAADSESHTDLGLNPSTAYHYRVKAVNAYGSSAYSDVATDTTDAAPVLSAGVSVGAGAAMFTSF